MLLNCQTDELATVTKKLCFFCFHACTALTFVCIFAVSSAYATTVYSDSWLEGSDPAGSTYEEGGTIENSYRVIGCGLTEANYGDDWELHSVRAATTVRSPNGRSFTRTAAVYYTWNQGSNFTARAESSLSWDSSDMGDYIVSTRHYSTCPATELGSTGLVTKVGVSISCYELISFNSATRIATLRRIEPCDTHCGNSGDTVTFRYVPPTPPQFVVRGEPYVKKFGVVVCGRIGTNPKRVTSCQCGNVETNIAPIPIF